MSIEEIAAKGILGLRAPPPKIRGDDVVEPEAADTAFEELATDVVSLATQTDYGNGSNDDKEDGEEVPISTDSLPIMNFDDVPLPLDSEEENGDGEAQKDGNGSQGGDLISGEYIQVTEAVVEEQVVEYVEEEIAPAMTTEEEQQAPSKTQPPQPPQGTVAGSGSTEKENLIWPDADSTQNHDNAAAVPDYTAKPKKREEIEPPAVDKEEEPFVQPIIILDAPPPPSAADEETETPAATDAYSYEEVSAEEYAQEFSIVLERCADGSGFASNDASSDAGSEEGNFATNPCVRMEPTFVGCTDANLFGASNPFDGTVIRTTVAFSYDLYMRRDVGVDDAVASLEETMLRHVAGGMNFDKCGATNENDDDKNAGAKGDPGRRLYAGDGDQVEVKTDISFVGLSSRPVDVEDVAYSRCTSNLSIEGEDISESEIECVPIKGRMTLYLSSKDDRFAAKHLIKNLVKSGAEDGSFVGAGDTEAGNDILGVAYVENRALDSARLPGNNLEQFKASAGMSGLAIGLVSFLGVFVSCFAFGLVGMRRNNKRRSENNIFDEEADDADLVKGEDGSFPTFPQLAKITPNDKDESEADLENPEAPVPTMTKTASSELLSVGSADLGCNADDSTVHASNPKECDAIHSVPLPPPAAEKDWAATGATAAVLASEANKDEEECDDASIPGFQTTGSTEFGKPDDVDEEDSLPIISTAGSMDFGTEIFSPIKFTAASTNSTESDGKVKTPESYKVSGERRLKTEVLLGKSPPFYGA